LRWADDSSQAIAEARAQSVTTHAAPAAVEGCALLAEILVEAIATGDKPSVLQHRSANEPSIAAIAAGSWRGKERDAIRSSGYVVHTLEAAVWCIDRVENFSDAVPPGCEPRARCRYCRRGHRADRRWAMGPRRHAGGLARPPSLARRNRAEGPQPAGRLSRFP
jgi:hypothetical protein